MTPQTTSIIPLDELVAKVLDYNPKADVEKISAAYNLAQKAHEGVKRLSGDPYFAHPLEVTNILTAQRMDTPTLCAALLHDVLEDTNIKKDDLIKEFGEEVVALVDGVTKIDEIKLESKEERKAEDLRKILIATAKDVRVILIKLADRLHNMRTLRYQPEEKQILIAKETLDIYAPLANKLGMNRVKSELEDLCMFHLQPELYQYFKQRINKKKEVREAEVAQLLEQLEASLEKEGLKAKVTGRAKNFYSIYQKMRKKQVSFDEIYDLVGIRIIVDKVEDCYKALGVIHRLWRPMPGKFKDYISVPKFNGYQSLHTVAIGKLGKMLEVQIRTWEMHYGAEEGIAAHWLYKGDEKDKGFDKKVTWLKQILEWLRESPAAGDFIDTLKIDLFKDEIIVFTPKGKPIPLPEKATPIDFGFFIHTDIGLTCSKAKVNGKLVPLTYKLKSGDIVEIITAKNATPSRAWLKSVRTNFARSKIRQKLGITLDKKKSEPPKKEEKKTLDIISGMRRTSLKFSKCCTPKQGDEIRSFRTTDGKFAIHKKDCINVHTQDPSREVELHWEEQDLSPVYKIIAQVKDRVGMLSDVLTVFTENKMNIDSVRTNATKDHVRLHFTLPLHTEEEVKNIVTLIRKVPDVLDVRYEVVDE